MGLVCQAASALYRFKGEWAKARSLSERGIAAWRAENITFGLSAALASSAWILAQLGEANGALIRLRESEQLLEHDASTDYFHFHRSAFHSMGRASLLLGRLDEARSMGDRAVEYSRSHGGTEADALLLLADIASHPARFDADTGAADYGQALALAEPRSMRPLVAHCHLGLGKLYRRTRKNSGSGEHLVTAATMYREMGMTYWLEQAEGEMREVA